MFFTTSLFFWDQGCRLSLHCSTSITSMYNYALPCSHIARILLNIQSVQQRQSLTSPLPPWIITSVSKWPVFSVCEAQITFIYATAIFKNTSPLTHKKKKNKLAASLVFWIMYPISLSRPKVSLSPSPPFLSGCNYLNNRKTRTSWPKTLESLAAVWERRLISLCHL